jgi:hypothetical protein
MAEYINQSTEQYNAVLRPIKQNDRYAYDILHNNGAPQGS